MVVGLGLVWWIGLDWFWFLGLGFGFGFGILGFSLFWVLILSLGV